MVVEKFSFEEKRRGDFQDTFTVGFSSFLGGVFFYSWMRFAEYVYSLSFYLYIYTHISS